jgi:hypothetical protein
MKKRPSCKTVATFLTLACVSCPLIVRGQSSGPASPQTATKPADSPAQVPPSTTPEKQKPKKVWTNDEIGSVKSGVSVVGGQTAASPSAEAKVPSPPSEETRQEQVNSYRERIRDYQSKMDAIDQRIAQLKNFKADNTSPSGGINLHQGYDMVPLEEQVKQLEEQKKKLQAKLDDTEAEARKNGIEPGELR